MNTASRKALKIIIFFIALVAYMILAKGYYNGLSLQHLSTGFLLAAAAYVAITLFGFLSPACGGLIALIGTVAGFFGIAWVMGKASAAVSWQDDERMCWIFTGIVMFCMILDIRYIIHSLRQPKAEQTVAEPSISGNVENNIPNMNDLKSNPTFVLSVADVLEQELGRKPTTEEVLDRMEHMRVIDPSEISQS